jgi:hypothetical protein
VLVRNILPGAGSSFPSSLTSVGGTLSSAADDGLHGRRPWRVPTA